MGAYATHAAEYAAAGLAVFPVDTRAKRPAVRNWQKATARASRAWAAKFPDCDGLGVLMGAPSRIVEVDVDMVGDAALGAALERFGETPITIRTASGKSKAWYRHNGERRLVRPITGLDVDVLGGGFTVAPPSWRDDLGAGYRFLTGGLADLDSLPTIRAGALETRVWAAEGVMRGERNDRLYRWAMAEAHHCDDLAALEDACATWAGAMPDPLSAAEVAAVARSAWSYQCRGRNFIGVKKPQVTARDATMDKLQDAPDAFFLLSIFERYHRARADFAISPAAMSKAGNPPWHYTRIGRARDVLVERGFLVEVAAPERGRKRAGVYRLKIAESVHNHFTPSSPSLEPASVNIVPTGTMSVPRSSTRCVPASRIVGTDNRAENLR